MDIVVDRKFLALRRSRLTTRTAGPGRDPIKIAEFTFPRQTALVYGVSIGVLIGIGNAFLGIVLPSWPVLLGLLVLAIATVLVLHEGLHGGVGALLGHRPLFGFEPPLVYTTFDVKIPRGHFVMIALAPLIVLDAVAIALYASGVLAVFADLCFAVNTIGAVGDLWIVLKLSRQPRGTYIQDTKTGVDVWQMPD